MYVDRNEFGPVVVVTCNTVQRDSVGQPTAEGNHSSTIEKRKAINHPCRGEAAVMPLVTERLTLSHCKFQDVVQAGRLQSMASLRLYCTYVLSWYPEPGGFPATYERASGGRRHVLLVVDSRTYCIKPN